MFQELLRAVRHTLSLFGREGARRKVVDAAREAALDEARVQPHKVFHLLLLDDTLHLQLV